jgi:choline dehydrogenase-like flavoprotein
MAGNYDIIVIGSGAAGGTLARQLAPTGKRILILERGDWLKRGGAELRRQGGVCRRRGRREVIPEH